MSSRGTGRPGWAGVWVTRLLLSGGALTLALALPARAGELEALEQVGGGVALGLGAVLAIAWIVARRRYGAEAQSASAPEPAPSPRVTRHGIDRPAKRIERLRHGLAERRQLLAQGGEGFAGDAQVFARYQAGLERLRRGEQALAPELPPGTLERLRGLHEQLLNSSPQRALGWPQRRTEVAQAMTDALGSARAERGLAILDRLADLRGQRLRPAPAQALEWTSFLGELCGAEELGPELVVVASGSGEEPATVDSDALFPPGAPQSRLPERGSVELQGSEEPPTMDSSDLFGPPGPGVAAGGTPATSGVPQVAGPSRAAGASECAEGEEPPTMDTSALFGPADSPATPGSGSPAHAESEEPPTLDTRDLFGSGSEAEEEPPTLDTRDLFAPGDHDSGGDASIPGEDTPTVDAQALFLVPGPIRGATPEPSDEADPPTVDAQDLFRGEGSRGS